MLIWSVQKPCMSWQNRSNRRNKLSTIDLRTNYATCFRELEVDNDDKNFVFLDEVRFVVVTRPSRCRHMRGESAYLSVTEARSRNISVVAVMNKYGMIYHKIHERAVNDEDLKLSIKEINESCQPQGILTPIFVIDNARIHQYRGLNDDEKLLRGARTELQLRISICEKFNEKEEHCGSFCRKKASDFKIINLMYYLKFYFLKIIVILIARIMILIETIMILIARIMILIDKF
ncbi:hypothetical protein CWI36_0306p0010 [Hamiltosporidium magnivora]|uniref:Tc1-like transposase DDE domain-containing protein n=1 Tax=Hamiltosporidium magnivora TaxID=148818 RepID=A0A4Q9LGS3_9MICR|nr:hypothetical protein CWI36_0306p0010 [Hamiltosporidium magnivora]